MAYESLKSTTSAAAARGQRVMDMAQDTAERAGAYLRRQVAYVSDRAQDLSRAMSESVHRSTGRSAAGWVSDTRGYVRAHPLQMLGVLVGVGYVLGKILGGSREPA